MIAFSGFRTWGVGKSIPLVFIEEFFVVPAYRNRGVGHHLLSKTLTNDKTHRRARVGCVVRDARQQRAAWHLYSKMGMRSRPARKHLIDVQRRPVELWPVHACGETPSEYYLEGPIADATAALGPERRMTNNDDTRGFELNSFPSPTDTFVRENRSFMLELKRCHDPRLGGDGGDPYAVLAAAEKVYVAYARG